MKFLRTNGFSSVCEKQIDAQLVMDSFKGCWGTISICRFWTIEPKNIDQHIWLREQNVLTWSSTICIYFNFRCFLLLFIHTVRGVKIYCFVHTCFYRFVDIAMFENKNNNFNCAFVWELKTLMSLLNCNNYSGKRIYFIWNMLYLGVILFNNPWMFFGRG